MRVDLLSTAVAPLGSGLGGGVEHMVNQAARQLNAQGHAVRIIAPLESAADVPELLTLPGRLAPTMIGHGHDRPLSIEADAFLVVALRRLVEFGLVDEPVLLELGAIKLAVDECDA